MVKIHDHDGNEIAEIELSDKQARVLAAGEDIVVIYHTPQTMRGLLGHEAGSYQLRKLGDLVVADDVAVMRRHAAMQASIRKARGA